jgi:hypothetical protein
MSTTVGRVIEAYGRGNETWITVWDFDRREKFAVILEAPPELAVSRDVKINRDDQQIESVTLASGETLYKRH